MVTPLNNKVYSLQSAFCPLSSVCILLLVYILPLAHSVQSAVYIFTLTSTGDQSAFGVNADTVTVTRLCATNRISLDKFLFIELPFLRELFLNYLHTTKNRPFVRSSHMVLDKCKLHSGTLKTKKSQAGLV